MSCQSTAARYNIKGIIIITGLADPALAASAAKRGLTQRSESFMCLQPVKGHDSTVKRLSILGLVWLALAQASLAAPLAIPPAATSHVTPHAATDRADQPVSDEASMPVILWTGKSGRGLYEVALLRAILDSTAENYPSYQLSVNSSRLGTLRGRQVIAEGELANVYVSGLREDNYTRDRDIIMLRQPVMKGLLGYRAAIIRQGDSERYAQAAAQHELRNLVIGQGHSWEDASILRHNNFTVNDNGRFEYLFEMLTYARFDAIFLGVAEIEQELAATALNKQLTIAYQPIIYYPHAMVFQVSGQHPKLAQRIAEGFKRVSDNGTHDKLLKQYFGAAIERIGHQDTQILVLSHPDPTLIPELTQPLLAPQHN